MSGIKEIWKSVTGYANPYSVSNLGRMRREGGVTFESNILKGSKTRCGYIRIILRDRVLLHRLVATAFLGECPEGHQVNHKDGNKLNNCLSNLEYVTPSQNIRHAYKTGLIKLGKGENHYKAKFTMSQIDDIRQEYSFGNTTHKKIAEKYGVCRETISNIIRKEVYK